MAISVDTASYYTGAGYVTTVTWSHTCSASANRLLMVAGESNISAVTYAGVSLTQGAEGAEGGSGRNGSVWYLINPASGTNTVVVSLTSASHQCHAAVSFAGVDQTSPFRDTDEVTASAASTITSGSLSCGIGDIITAWPFSDSLNAACEWTVSGYTTSYCIAYCPPSANCTMNTAMFYKTATATSETVTATTGVYDIGMQSYVLRQYVPSYGRATRYWFNVWDPRGVVKDRNDAVVPANSLRADSWLEMQGVAHPTSTTSASYVEDATKSYIVEVDGSTRGAILRASRNQFADSLIKRAAAGRA
jgi:hypothetical protein